MNERVTALTEEIGEGCLYLSGDGQGLDSLKADTVVRANAPRSYRSSGFDTAHLSRYTGTDFLQWHGRKSDGRFYPFGKILRLTPAGRRILSKENNGAKA